MKFNRSLLVMGTDGMKRLDEINVIIFGIGGVGSWCAECLIRTGVKHLTIVDSDTIAESNINRQLMATSFNVGDVKTEAMKRRLLTINPDADITAIPMLFTEVNSSEFNLDQYDYIIDAIDSLADKMALINIATRTKAVFCSSMGAALKMDPTRIRIAEFWQVKGCPLARALRNRMKKSGIFPARKFKCVFSDELIPNKAHSLTYENDKLSQQTNTPLQEDPGHNKVAVNGSLMHITATYGLMLASLIIQDCYNPAQN